MKVPGPKDQPPPGPHLLFCFVFIARLELSFTSHRLMVVRLGNILCVDVALVFRRDRMVTTPRAVDRARP